MSDRNDSEPKSREELERLHGRLWTEAECDAEFWTTAIVELTVIVRRKSDDQVGSLDYQNEPRLYFNYRPAPVSGE